MVDGRPRHAGDGDRGPGQRRAAPGSWRAPGCGSSRRDRRARWRCSPRARRSTACASCAPRHPAGDHRRRRRATSTGVAARVRAGCRDALPRPVAGRRPGPQAAPPGPAGRHLAADPADPDTDVMTRRLPRQLRGVEPVRSGHRCQGCRCVGARSGSGSSVMTAALVVVPLAVVGWVLIDVNRRALEDSVRDPAAHGGRSIWPGPAIARSTTPRRSLHRAGGDARRRRQRRRTCASRSRSAWSPPARRSIRSASTTVTAQSIETVIEPGSERAVAGDRAGRAAGARAAATCRRSARRSPARAGRAR
jgi:hypothetical protein